MNRTFIPEKCTREAEIGSTLKVHYVVNCDRTQPASHPALC
jgi:hypothetical protein